MSRLNEILVQRATRRLQKLQEGILDLATRVQDGSFEQFDPREGEEELIRQMNSLLKGDVHSGKPQARCLVEITEEDTWKGMLDQLRLMSVGAMSDERIDVRLRTMSPEVIPGVYEVWVWSGIDLPDPDVPMKYVKQYHEVAGATGCYAPFLKYCLTIGVTSVFSTVYALSPHLQEMGVGEPEGEDLFLAGFSTDRSLQFRQGWAKPGRSGGFSYVGARLVTE